PSAAINPNKDRSFLSSTILSSTNAFSDWELSFFDKYFLLILSNLTFPMTFWNLAISKFTYNAPIVQTGHFIPVYTTRFSVNRGYTEMGNRNVSLRSNTPFSPPKRH